LPDHSDAAKVLLPFSIPPLARGKFTFRDVHAILVSKAHARNRPGLSPSKPVPV
jgi:hypothetical protein